MLTEAKPQRELTIEADLHPAQVEVWLSPARFRVVACGRRFGKTFLASLEILTYAIEHTGSVCWWVAPVHDQADIAFRMVLGAMSPGMLALCNVNLTKKTITLWHGARIVFKSADQDKNLRGEGVWFMVLDEAAFLAETAWFGALRPSLSDHVGDALLIGTFDGDNWFYDMYRMGQDPTETQYASWRFPTAANPHIEAAEIEHARKMLSREQFEQEYLANPLVYVGAVFDGEDVERAVVRGIAYREQHGDSPRARLALAAGVDWGFNNPTVFEVAQVGADDTMHWFDETVWHATELNLRCRLIAEKCRAWEIGHIYTDAAGADENFTLEEWLYKLDAPTTLTRVPFNKYKEAGIQARRWFLESDRESISPTCRALAHDTRRYHYKAGTDRIAESNQVTSPKAEKIDDHSVDAATAVYAVMFGDVAGRD